MKSSAGGHFCGFPVHLVLEEVAISNQEGVEEWERVVFLQLECELYGLLHTVNSVLHRLNVAPPRGDQ